MNKAFYNFMRGIAGAFFRIGFRLKISGQENLPTEGGYILCANHLNLLDPVLMCAFIPKRHVHFMAKAELFEKKILAKLLEAFGAFPVSRGNTDLGSIRKALGILKDGEPLGIFPQGTRSRDNSRTPLHAGVALIAVRAGVPIIPAYIDGNYRAFSKMTLTFGKPVDISDFCKRVDSTTMEAVTERIGDAIWALKES